MMGGGVSGQVFSADGKTLLMSGHMGLNVWDLAGSKPSQPRALRVENFYFHNATVALSGDGKTAAVLSMMGGNQDMPIHFFDTATGTETRQIENDQHINGLSFSPDGRFLAVAVPPRIELWDAANGDEVRVFATEPNTFYRLLVFSPDGKMLAAVAQFNRFPQPAEPSTVIQIWETASGKERLRVRLAAAPMQAPNQRRVYYAQGANGLAFSTDGRFLAASGNDSAIHLWDLHTGKESASLSGFEGNAGALLFSPDGRELLAMDTKGNRLAWKMADIRRLHSARLPSLSESTFAELWTELAQTDAFRAYRAERHLLADPKRAVALLGSQLKPVPPGDTTRLRQLAADLNNASAAVRRKAMMELRTKHGEAALGALTPNGNVRRNNFGMSFEQKLRDLYNTPERRATSRPWRILEAIGTPEAKQVLEKLSQGAAGVSLTTAAKSALEHLAAVKDHPRTPAFDEFWTDLASEDAARAYRAMCGLSAAPSPAAGAVSEGVETDARCRRQGDRGASDEPGSRRFQGPRTGDSRAGKTRRAGGAGPQKGAGRQTRSGGPQAQGASAGAIDHANIACRAACPAFARSAGAFRHDRGQARPRRPGRRRALRPSDPRGEGVPATAVSALTACSCSPRVPPSLCWNKMNFRRGRRVFPRGQRAAENAGEQGADVGEFRLATLMPPSYTYSFRTPGPASVAQPGRAPLL